MFHIALYEPEIPPNTGNIMRLCVNTNSTLHLIHPVNFDLDEKRLRRAGMDYRDIAVIVEHENYATFLTAIDAANNTNNIYALTTKGKRFHAAASFQPGDVFLFGPESRGLPDSVLDTLDAQHKLRIPIISGSRSLNLSNTAAIMVYEALRQHDFVGLC